MQKTHDYSDRILSQDGRILAVVRRIADALPSGSRVLLVGGFVRDALRGELPKDADVEIYGVTIDVLETILQKLFPGQVNKVGAVFCIFNIRVDDIECDVAIPRRESKIAPGHGGFSVTGDPSMTLEEASQRRDFTYNALAADPTSGEIFDFHNGVTDLEKKILRMVDATHFAEDPLRVYRAMQCIGRFGGSVEPKTMGLMAEMVVHGDLNTLSKERVTDEWKKLFLKSPEPSRGLELGRALGIIAKYFPELDALERTPQEPEWHPEGNVWIHTLMTLDVAADIIRRPAENFSDTEKLQIMLGTLCHDLGKPATTRSEDGRMRSHGHSAAGELPTKSFFAKFTFGKDIADAVVTLCLHHLNPGVAARSLQQKIFTTLQYENAVRKMIRQMYPASWRVLLAVAEADHRGRALPGARTKAYDGRDLFESAVAEKKLDLLPTKPLVSGDDIFDTAKQLGIELSPCPYIGELIAILEEMRDDGTIVTKTQAINALKKILWNQ